MPARRVAIIEEKILCVHAGLSPSLSNLEQLRQIKRCAECITLEAGGVVIFNSIALIHPARQQADGDSRRGAPVRPAVVGPGADDPGLGRVRPWGEPWPTAAIPLKNPYCSCKLSVIRPGELHLRGGRGAEVPGQVGHGLTAAIPMENPCCGCKLTRHGLQLQPLWIIPAAAVS